MPELGVRSSVPVVGVEALLGAADALVVDLRSPGEFAVDHVAGAVNLPLFDDTERAILGWLYTRRSPQEAFDEGRRRTAAKIERFASELARTVGWSVPAVDLRERVERMTENGIAALEDELSLEPLAEVPPRTIALHCWRGGLRSRSVVAFLRGLGLERAVALEGGYKTYRGHVRSELERWDAPPTWVLRGLTGVGKTLVLRAVEELRPGWTLDLEGLAQHRSSILGMVGLEPCSQKHFESRLFERLREGFPGPCVVEGESRKIGDVIIPPRVWGAMTDGESIELCTTIERRVEVLATDYLAHPGNRAEIARQLPFIERRMGPTKWGGELVRLLDEDRIAELVEILLERYYDPLYRHSEKGRSYVLRVDAGDPERAARELVDWIDGRRD